MHKIVCGILALFGAYFTNAQFNLLNNSIDTIYVKAKSTAAENPLQQSIFKKRQKLVAYTQIGAYGANFATLYNFWYKDYPLTSFHFWNDNEEYLQVDKVSHMYGTYTGGRISMELWKWAGVSKKKYMWLGAMTGLAYETVIEIMDGFGDHWGFSVGDYAANILGTGLLVGQEAMWDEQRITIKFSTHYETYNPPELERFAKRILGQHKINRLFKDYNTQTYWFSCNLKSFFKQSKLPPWLNIAVGYGGNNIIGARHIGVIDENGVEMGADDIYPRYRQWYIAPDIDLTKIKTKSKLLKVILFLANSFKFPTPSLELSQGNLKWNWLHF